MDIPTLRLPDGDDDMTVKVSLHHHEAATMSRHSTMANGDERTREDTVGGANIPTWILHEHLTSLRIAVRIDKYTTTVRYSCDRRRPFQHRG